MTNQRISNLEHEKVRLMQELEGLRQRGGVRPNQNTNIDYSQAIRELSQKNEDLRSRLNNYRMGRRESNRNALSVPTESSPIRPGTSPNPRYDDLLRQYDQMRRDNQNLKNGMRAY